MKVLVIQQRMGIGDMVIFLPYIHAISKKYKIPISVLAKKNSKIDEICANDKHIEEIIFLNRNSKKNGLHDGWVGFYKLLKEIKNKNFDKVYIFNGSLRFLILCRLARIKSILQYPLFTKKDNIVLTAKYFVQKNTIEIISTQPKIYLDSIEVQKIKKKYKFTNDFKHICFGFSASGPTKRWDIQNYVRLAKNLTENYPCKFYLAGGKADENLFLEFFNSSLAKNCISFEKLSIKETLPIIKNCDFYIGNDTGWLHIASALNLKCLALFMDSPALAYGKYSKNISIVVPHGQSEESTTHNTLGKDKISFNEVLRKTIELLN